MTAAFPARLGHRACGPAVPVALPLLWLLYHHSPESPGSLWPVCLFHCFTGLHCPGCGGTRALYWLIHGDLSRSLRCNILLLLLAGSLLALWGFSSLARKPAFVFGVAGAEVLFFLLRNLPCFPFPLLSPREDSRLFLCLRRCAVGAFPEKSLTSNLKRKTLRHGKQCWRSRHTHNSLCHKSLVKSYDFGWYVHPRLTQLSTNRKLWS